MEPRGDDAGAALAARGHTLAAGVRLAGRRAARPLGSRPLETRALSNLTAAPRRDMAGAVWPVDPFPADAAFVRGRRRTNARSEEPSELQSPIHLVCRLLLETKKIARSGAEKLGQGRAIRLGRNSLAPET